MSLIVCEKISKFFSLQTGKKLIRERVGEIIDSGEEEDRFYALRDVSFTVERGESLGIVGRNGAGKSTLLSVITGLAKPDAGKVEVNGRVAPLLEIGSGFHPDLTGRENLRLNASLLGLSRTETDTLQPAIIDFADIGDHIDAPLRTYSSGMMLRLAFGVAMQLNPEILIVDELLAVGDAAFQSKCLSRIQQMLSSGASLLFVSHAPGMVAQFCKSAVWLDQGRVMRYGPAGEVVNTYLEFCSVAPVSVEEPVRVATRSRKIAR